MIYLIVKLTIGKVSRVTYFVQSLYSMIVEITNAKINQGEGIGHLK